MKRIAVIGGGISGLAVLHYLKTRYQDTLEITLYERNPLVGGAIATIDTNDFAFETGPNAFLANQPNTLEFLKEIDFADQIIEANEASGRRYIQLEGTLHPLPTDPKSFLKTPILSLGQKLRLLAGLFIKNISKETTIHDYVTLRFGKAVAERLVDPFLTGIYAGDIKRLHMEAAFPRFKKGKEKTKTCSFKYGMGSLVKHLGHRYQSHIQNNTEIKDLVELKADLIICCVPAHVAGDLLGIDVLKEIPYSPVAVVGLGFKRRAFKNEPDGFGYLIPSGENKAVLGVLLESNVFPRQVKADEIFIRVMLGGRHHPEILQKTPQQIMDLAVKELQASYGLAQQPLATAMKLWAKAIPQYELDYPEIRKQLARKLEKTPQIRLCANYLDGISFNDCLLNARNLVEKLEF